MKSQLLTDAYFLEPGKKVQAKHVVSVVLLQNFTQSIKVAYSEMMFPFVVELEQYLFCSESPNNFTVNLETVNENAGKAETNMGEDHSDHS